MGSPQQFILGSEMKWTLGLLFVASVALALPRRDAKAFSLFSVVTFPNEECRTMMTGEMFGQCVTSEECTTSGGSPSGNCASGFGVCCFRFVEATGTTTTVTVNTDVTYIQSEDFPTAVGNTAPVTAATHTFQIAGDASICQIKLDFDTAVLSQPTAANSGTTTLGVCRGAGTTGDALTVTTADGSFPGFSQLCGTLTGQHIYLDTSRDNPGATVIIRTGTVQFARSWKILARRLRCDDPNLSPGCLQYHTGLAGRITSFNGGIADQVMLRNLDYEVCVRPGANMCGMMIRAQAAQAGGPTPFNLQTSAAGTTSTNSMTGDNEDIPGGTAATAFLCVVEGIVVRNSLVAGLLSPPQTGQPPIFCGGKLNGFSNSPFDGTIIANDLFGGGNTFAIGVISNNGASSTDTGFDIGYQQYC